MPHTVEWMIPQRVIYMYIEGDVDLPGIQSVNTDIMTLLDSGTAPVYLVVSDENVQKMPINLASLKRTLEFMCHPALRFIISIGQVNPILNYVIPVVTQMIGVEFVRCNTMEDAQRYLQRIDYSLNEDAST